ncbi:MAG: hypothetical protein M0P69_19460, partial [Bacteroidales bacterium]|nr:hypothetical protein [Bacteroidales bacterium]
MFLVLFLGSTANSLLAYLVFSEGYLCNLHEFLQKHKRPSIFLLREFSSHIQHSLFLVSGGGLLALGHLLIEPPYRETFLAVLFTIDSRTIILPKFLPT